MKKLVLFLSLLISFSSCEKEAGEGGTSVIQGQVYKIHTFQNFTTGEWDTLYYQLDAGKDVFIIYSNNEEGVYDDKFETDYNGRYRFEFLRNGDYTLYTYTDSTVEISSTFDIKYEYPVFKHIKISSNNSENFVDDFVIEKNQ
jgi:hypothetical protein